MPVDEGSEECLGSANAKISVGGNVVCGEQPAELSLALSGMTAKGAIALADPIALCEGLGACDGKTNLNAHDDGHEWTDANCSLWINAEPARCASRDYQANCALRCCQLALSRRLRRQSIARVWACRYSKRPPL